MNLLKWIIASLLTLWIMLYLHYKDILSTTSWILNSFISAPILAIILFILDFFGFEDK